MQARLVGVGPAEKTMTGVHLNQNRQVSVEGDDAVISSATPKSVEEIKSGIPLRSRTGSYS